MAHLSNLSTNSRSRRNGSNRNREDVAGAAGGVSGAGGGGAAVIDFQCDMAFEPTSIYKLWNDRHAEQIEGRQEDAEEFLSYILNRINDEMLDVCTT